MSTIKVDTIATRTGSGNITASNTIAGNLTGNVTGNVTGNLTGNSTVGGTLGVTGLITASAGVSIGSGGDSNVIDDYEEGTFTPTFSTQSSYQFRAGRYVKIGRQVIIQVEMRYVQSGTTHGSIGGFPYAIRETNYVSLFVKEYNSTGHAFHTSISVGNTSTNNFRKVSDNTNTASNGTVYGWGFTLAYETYT